LSFYGLSLWLCAGSDFEGLVIIIIIIIVIIIMILFDLLKPS